MSDFRQIPKTAVVPVVDGELDREREWRRRTHRIREGKQVTIINYQTNYKKVTIISNNPENIDK